MPTSCPICQKRRGKRFCPGLGRSRWAGKTETICAQCCGEQREVTIDCPADCPYLVSAHRYEAQRAARPEPGTLPFENVAIDRDFLEDNQPLIAGLSLLLVRYAGEHSEVHDGEVLAALDALAKGYQTLESGLYYEQAPEHPAARAVYTAAQAYLNQFSQEQQQRLGASLRPGDALRAAVFLRRLGQLEGNGRPLSRRYLAFLRSQLPVAATAQNRTAAHRPRPLTGKAHKPAPRQKEA